MSGAEKAVFQAKFPPITDQAAAQSLAGNGEIVSLNGRSGTGDFFVVTFVSSTSRIFGPLVLNRTCAEALHSLLGQNGFPP